MAVKFASVGARSFDTYPRAESLEVRDVRLPTIPAFIGSFVGGRVNEAVMEIHSMKKSRRPELSGEAGAIKERSNFDCQGVVVYFSTAVLGGAVGAGGFDNISEFPEHHVTEGSTTSQLAALIGSDSAGGNAKLRHKRAQDVERRFFGLCKKRPDPVGRAIDNNEVG